MKKHTLKFNDLNLYLSSLTLGLLHYIKNSKNYDLGIWSLGMPMFRENLKRKGVDQRLIDIIEIFDELSAMNFMRLDVGKLIQEKIEVIIQIMDELSCSNQVKLYWNSRLEIESSANWTVRSGFFKICGIF